MQLNAVGGHYACGKRIGVWGVGEQASQAALMGDTGELYRIVKQLQSRSTKRKDDGGRRTVGGCGSRT